MSVRCRAATRAHISIADAASLRLASWAIGCCVRIDAQPASSNTFTLISKGGLDATTKACYALQYRESAGSYQLRAAFWDATGAAVAEHTVTITLALERWYTVAASFDNASDTLTLYYVARESPSVPVAAASLTASSVVLGGTPAPFASTATLRLGAGSSSASLPTDGLSGCLADAWIYSSAISEATLESRLGQRLVGTETNLVGYWTLDEDIPGGVTAYDRASGTHHDGTLESGASWADDPLDLYYPTGMVQSAIVGWHTATLRRGATITASDEDASWPASALRSPRQSIPTRTANATGTKTWTFSFNGPAPIWLVTVDGHNLSSAAVITIKLHSADSWAGPDITEAIRYHPKVLRHMLARPYQYGFARLSITDASAAGGYMQLGAVHFWTLWESHRQADLDAETWAITDPSVVAETRHRDQTVRTLATSVDPTLSFPDLRRGSALEFRRILQEIGGGAPVFACPEPRRGLYGRSVYGFAARLPSESIADPSWDAVAMDGLTIAADRAIA